MARVEQSWSASEFDAIGIRAQQGKFVIQGIDGDQVKLEGNVAARYSRNLHSGRWVAGCRFAHHGSTANRNLPCNYQNLKSGR